MTPPPVRTWRLARSLETLRAQINAAWPDRSKATDGAVGDLRHQGIKSDHDPDVNGIVKAIDVTNDPAHECHAALICEAIRASRDKRVAYLIFNHFMLRSYDKPGIPAWTWAEYTGEMPHDHHFHISVVADRADDTTQWRIA